MVTIAALIVVYVAVTTQIAYLTTTIERRITMSGQATIDKITAQLGKVKNELLTTLADLKSQQVDTTALEAVAQALDDIVPDVPEVEADAPADEPPTA